MTSARRLSLAVLLAAFVGTPVLAQAPAEDDMAPRVRACGACHGEHGRSAEEAYAPSIAGKPAGYLFEQLRNFRDGRRQNVVMQPMLAFLTDDYLREIARHYASEEGAARVAQRGSAEDELNAGRTLVEQGDDARKLPACRGCHGEELLGHEPAIPGLLALSPDYLAAQLGAWRSGVRNAKKPDCMAQVASLLTPAEISAVTAWIASRPVPAEHRPSADTPATLPLACGAAP